MPAEAAAPVAAPNAAEVVTPVAEQSFGEQWARAGEEAAASEEATEEAPAEETAEVEGDGETAEETTEPKPKEVVTDPLAELKALAKKHGFDLDGAKVTAKERGDFREWKKSAREEIAALRRQAEQEVEALRTPAMKEVETARALKAAIDQFDLDAIAQHAGHKDWETLQAEAVNHHSDPSYKRIKQLENQYAEEKKLRETEAAARQADLQTQRQRQAQQQYKQTLANNMKASGDKFVANMHDDPWFVSAIYDIQQEHWDGHETITPEEAIRVVPRGGQKSVYDRMLEVRDRLNRALADDETEPAPTLAPVTNGKRPAPKTGVVGAGKKGAEPTTPRKITNDEEWFEHFRSTINNASAEDARREREQRGR